MTNIDTTVARTVQAEGDLFITKNNLCKYCEILVNAYYQKYMAETSYPWKWAFYQQDWIGDKEKGAASKWVSLSPL